MNRTPMLADLISTVPVVRRMARVFYGVIVVEVVVVAVGLHLVSLDGWDWLVPIVLSWPMSKIAGWFAKNEDRRR